MQLRILAVGKLKDPAMATLCHDYLRRLGRHLKAQVIEVRDEAELQRRLPDDVRLVVLDAQGAAYDSEGFARWLERQLNWGRQDLVFLLGGADGLSKEVRSRAHESLSLGPLTLPHRLARVVLVEQLYRAMTILRGEPYHK